ncbi:MAG: TRAP transporter large permease subunit [Desulfurococcales archaeon]|nr:TRAP transporter large permease subunit [Desulfurococcales archaeon]
MQRGTHVFFVLTVGFLLSYLRGWSVSYLGLRWALSVILALTTLIPVYLALDMFIDKGALLPALLLSLIYVLSILPPILNPLSRLSHNLRLSDLALAILALPPYLYLVSNYWALIDRAVLPLPLDVAMGWGMTLMLMGLVLRLIGPEMPLLVTAFILYDIYGYLLPRPWFHPGFDVEFLAGKLYAETEAALLGIVTGVSAKYVVYFTILAGVLGALGYGKAMGRTFLAFLGRSPASVGRASVGLGMGMGMVSGSGAADTAYVASTFKPLFKAAGYSDIVAAGIAANAGTLAYITPPILGSVAFLMIEILGIPYTWVIVMSIGPAILYAISILVYNEFYVRRAGIKPVPFEVKRGPELLIPFIPPALILTLIFLGYSVSLAVTVAVILAPFIALLDRDMRGNIRRVPEGLAEGLKLLAPVGASIVLANVIMSMVVLSGLHQKFTLALLELVGGNLVYAILFAFFFSLLLGMGVPPIATYTLSSLLTAPALVKLATAAGIPEGAALLATHMFLFYTAMLADITPPVGLSNFAAAAVYGLDPVRVGVRAALVAIPKYVYALSFIWSYWGTALLVLPVLLTMPLAQGVILIASRFAAVIAGIFFLSIANVGFYSGYHLGIAPRLLLALLSLLLFIPLEVLNLVGFIGCTVMLVLISRFKIGGLRKV